MRAFWGLHFLTAVAVVPQRLFSPPLSIEQGGRRPGHDIKCHHCWKAAPICYLQDFYVDPESRKTGRGRMLMEVNFRCAREDGAEVIYWMTQDFNAEARKLYDRIGRPTDVIKREV